MKAKKTIVVQSGGMDSALCLAAALDEYNTEDVLSLSFSYNQRHSIELERAKQITSHLNVDHVILDISCLSKITENSLTNKDLDIAIDKEGIPNTLVVGRNGLMARLAAIHANALGASSIYMGIIGVEAANSGYRDCSREYMDLMQNIMRIDLNDPDFEIRTPLVHLTKKETMAFGHRLNRLNYFLEVTVTCYEGIEKEGCQRCPACTLRNEGIITFFNENPELKRPSYFNKINV